jgi:hypothetical protein
MKIKVVVVDLEIPLRVKKWLVRLGVGGGLLLGGGAVAWAATLHSWSDGDTLNATDLNANFSALDARITALETNGASKTDLPIVTAWTDYTPLIGRTFRSRQKRDRGRLVGAADRGSGEL